MTRNIGNLERAVRAIVGLALIGAALGVYGPAYTTPWGWIGAVLLGTAAIGWCPPYALLGINTCGRKGA